MSTQNSSENAVAELTRRIARTDELIEAWDSVGVSESMGAQCAVQSLKKLKLRLETEREKWRACSDAPPERP